MLDKTKAFLQKMIGAGAEPAAASPEGEEIKIDAGVFGETSALRDRNVMTFLTLGVNTASTYTLNSTKVDFERARQLYRNTHDDYKLGGGFAKPIINTQAAFMGVPRFKSADKATQAILDEIMPPMTSRMLRTHILALMGGDCYVMPTVVEPNPILYPDKKAMIEYVIIPAAEVKEIEIDPLTKKVKGYYFAGKCKWVDMTGEGTVKEFKYSRYVTASTITTRFEGERPAGLVDSIEANPLGFLNILHFRNEPDEDEKYGQSELEPVEPYLKAYHDVMLHAITGSKNHSTPRLKLKLKDVEAFLKNNFPDALTAIHRGEQTNISLAGRELLLFTSEEDADYIEVKSAAAGAELLLEFIFYCIVDTSEIPEFVFGVHTPAALASVREQMPILVRRIARKREQVTETWQDFGRMMLVINGNLTGRKAPDLNVTIEWDPVVDRDEKEFAETLYNVAQALGKAIEGKFISTESAVNFFSQYVDSMSKYLNDDDEVPGEREGIMRDILMRTRLEDGQFLESQVEQIDRELGLKPAPKGGNSNA
jgi:hypothetical protein